MSTSGCVVVGGGLAAATLVATLREEGYGEPVVLVGDETVRPYERPALSKDYLQGKAAVESLFVHPPQWYGDHDVDTRFGETVVALDPGGAKVRLASGEHLAYRHLVLATGATPRTLPLPGHDLAGVHTLRRIGDADALRDAFSPQTRLVIVGAGWIGLEVAASARLAGAQVTVLETAATPLARVLGERIGASFAALHRDHGVDLRAEASVRAIIGTRGRVTGVETGDGVVPADLVLVAVGVNPDVALATEAGLEVDNGIVVDERMGASAPSILAVGDVANAYNTTLGRRLRVEHWDNAIRQGRLGAQVILGRDARYDWQPYFYTDQYDLGMEYVGNASPGDDVVVRGDVESGEYVAFWTRQGVVTAAMNVNVWDVNDTLREIVGRTVGDDRLGDQSVPLAEL